MFQNTLANQSKRVLAYSHTADLTVQKQHMMTDDETTGFVFVKSTVVHGMPSHLRRDRQWLTPDTHDIN